MFSHGSATWRFVFISTWSVTEDAIFSSFLWFLIAVHVIRLFAAYSIFWWRIRSLHATFSNATPHNCTLPMYSKNLSYCVPIWLDNFHICEHMLQEPCYPNEALQLVRVECILFCASIVTYDSIYYIVSKGLRFLHGGPCRCRERPWRHGTWMIQRKTNGNPTIATRLNTFLWRSLQVTWELQILL